jgi:hypothetical protein
VSIKLRLNVVSRPKREAGFELGVAPFAYANDRGRVFLHDPQASAWHDRSLPHSDGIDWPVEIKRHHYRKFGALDKESCYLLRQRNF